MGSPIISHIIGTVSLLVLFGIVSAYYTISYSSLQSEIIASNLQEVADYASSEIVDLVSLCSLSVEDQILIKEIRIPEEIRNYAYNLTIIESGELLKVFIYLTSNPAVFGESILPWLIGTQFSVFNGTNFGINGTGMSPRMTISSISNNPVAWCVMNAGKITFGLGVMEA